MPMDFLLDACDEIGFSWDSLNSLQNVASADWMGREVKVQKDCDPQRTFDSLRPLSLLPFTNSPMAGRVNVNPKPSQESRFSTLLCHGTYGHQSAGGASGEMGFVGTWGGKEGRQYGFYGEAKVQDKKGNSAQAKVTHNSDGTGDAKISVKIKKGD